jgi:hypothetical protein
MANNGLTVRLKGMGRRRLAEVAERARQLRMTPEGYLKHLVEEDIAFEREAREKSFTEILPGNREMTEAELRELDGLVEEARNRHHARVSKHRPSRAVAHSRAPSR